MPFSHDDNSAPDAGAQAPGSAPDPELVRSLEEITRLLRQMLTLAELSASDLSVDRQALQAMIERRRDEINRIADTI